jgi:hypothetical protein
MSRTRSRRGPRPTLHRIGSDALGLGALLFVLLLQGCAVLSPPRPREGGSALSDAAREAVRKDDDKHRRLEPGRITEPEEETVVIHDACPPAIDRDRCDPPVARAAGPSGRGRARPHLHVGLLSGTGTSGSRDFERYALGGILIGGRPTPGTRVDLALLGIPSRFTAASGLRAPFETPFELAADLSARVRLPRGRGGPELYPIVGFRLGTLFWNYRNPIVVDAPEGPRTVDDDWINYYAPYAGVGVSLVRTQRLEIGAHVTEGVRFYDSHTEEGFRNDRFESAAFTQVTVETTVRF